MWTGAQHETGKKKSIKTQEGARAAAIPAERLDVCTDLENTTSTIPNTTNPTRMHPIAYGSRNARMSRSASVGNSGPRSAPADAVETFAAPDDVDSTTICPARLVVASAQ